MAKYSLVSDSYNPPSSALSEAKRIATNVPLNALQGIQNILSPAELIGIKIPQPAQVIANSYGITPEERQPKGVLERGLERFTLGALPAAAIGGLPGLAALGLGTIAAEGAGLVGAPDWLKDLTQFGTEIGTGVAAAKAPEKLAKIPGIGKHLSKVKPVVTPAQAKNNLYASAEKLGESAPRVKDVNNVLKSSLEKVQELLGTETRKPIKKKVTSAIETILENYNENRLNPGKAFSIRKSLGKLGNELSSADSKKYIEPIRSSLNDFFATYSAEFPEFYTNLKKADQLHQLDSMKLYLGDAGKGLLDYTIGSIPFVKAKQLPLYQSASEALSSVLNGGEKITRGLFTKPAARETYFNAVKAVAENDPHLFAQNIIKTKEALIGGKKKTKSKSKYSLV